MKILLPLGLVQQCLCAMRASDIKVLANSVKSARNICFLRVDTKATAIRYFYPEGLIGLSHNVNNLVRSWQRH
jgi:hypothetical protein